MSATSSPSDSQSMTWPCWRLVLLLMAICFLAHFNRTSMAVAGDLKIMKEYHISETQMGLVYSAFLTTYTLLMIPSGWLIDRRGPRFALQVMCLGSAAFVVLTGLVGVLSSVVAAFMVLLFIRSLLGAISSPLHPASANAVSLGIPGLHRSGANGLVTGAALLGIASSFILFGWLIDMFDWPGAFVVAGGATAIIAALWTFCIPAGTLAVNQSDHKRVLHIANDAPANLSTFFIRNKNLLLLTCSYAAVGYFQYLFFYWMRYYFKDVLDLGEQRSAYYAAIPPLAMAFGMPFGGWLADRIQARFGWRAARGGMASSTMVLSAVLLLAGVQATQPVWIVTWMSLALGVLGMLEGPFWLTAVEVGGNRGGLSTGIFNTGGNVGGIVSPILTPWISKDLGFGWQVGLAIGSAFCFIGALLWFWIDDPRKSIMETSNLPPQDEPTLVEDIEQKNLIPNPAL